MTGEITVVPANEASCEELQAVFGTRGEAAHCQCQRFKTPATQWDREVAIGPVEQRAWLLREQTHCGQPKSPTTSGLIAHLDGEPVGWCAVEPRTAYVRLQRKPLVWAGRTEEKADEGVWSMPCLITPRDTAVAASPMPWPVPRSSMRASGAPAPLRAIP